MTFTQIWTAMEIQHYLWLGTPSLVCTGEIVQVNKNEHSTPIYITFSRRVVSPNME